MRNVNERAERFIGDPVLPNGWQSISFNAAFAIQLSKTCTPVPLPIRRPAITRT
jgi:hypothetical protein